jgi:GNAT superfamily N-acetyltransferase
VGALLINGKTSRPTITSLFVDQKWQRRGIGTAMLNLSALALQEESSGESSVLCSRCLLANEESSAWHSSAGFIEIPSWIVTNHRYQYARHNVKHGLVKDTYGAKRLIQMMKAKIAEMEARRDEDPEAYDPSYWLSADGNRIDAVVEYYSDLS